MTTTIHSHDGRRGMIFLAFLLMVLCFATGGSSQVPAGGAPPGQPGVRCDGCTVDSSPERRAWTILENDRVVVEGRHYPPGQRTDPPGVSHPETVPRDVMIIMLTPGDVEIITTGNDMRSGRFEAGTTWWWPKPPAAHAIANIGKESFDFLKISLK